jgi:hypothetical protein
MSQDTLDKTLILRDDLDEKIDVVKKEMDDARRLTKIAQKNQGLCEKARHYRNQLVLTALGVLVTAGGLLRPRPKPPLRRERELEQRNADIARREKELVDWGGDTVKASAKKFASRRWIRMATT